MLIKGLKDSHDLGPARISLNLKAGHLQKEYGRDWYIRFWRQLAMTAPKVMTGPKIKYPTKLHRYCYSNMRNQLSFFFLWFCLLPASPAFALQEPVGEPDQRHVIYVSSISWHTGIVVPAYSLPDSLWPEGHQYADSAYLEIGWGDADYYPNEGFNLWYAIKSVFWPTSSVLHVNPLHQAVEDYYVDTDVVRIAVNGEQLRNLSAYLIEEFEQGETGKFIPAEEGIYTDSHFYEGSSSYYFPNNSNVWAARALKRAGFSISPIWYQTTGWVLNKAENFGELVVEN